jgi:hypothetical protein
VKPRMTKKITVPDRSCCTKPLRKQLGCIGTEKLKLNVVWVFVTSSLLPIRPFLVEYDKQSFLKIVRVINVGHANDDPIVGNMGQVVLVMGIVEYLIGIEVVENL